jgi:hypothetical protein|eukprot:COSAG01_NODE_9182_length_2526_cov_2.032112_3_plen_513_part_00
MRTVAGLSDMKSVPTTGTAAGLAWPTCSDALPLTCARSNFQRDIECLKCTGAHQAVLMAAGCTEPELDSHCYTAANDTFVATLQSWHKAPNAAAIAKLFSTFVRKFNKMYTPEEKAARLRTFAKNVLSIVQHNKLITSSDNTEAAPSWTLTLNELSDRNASELMLTHAMDASQLPEYNRSSSTPPAEQPDELSLRGHAQCSFYQWVGCRGEISRAEQNCAAAVQRHACIAEGLVVSGCGLCYLRSAGVPATGLATNATANLRPGTESASGCYSDGTKPCDWRHHNIITPVKNQKQCGSCWAHSLVAMAETRHALWSHTGPNQVMSEQFFIDCALQVHGGPCSKPCGGCWPKDALEWTLKKNRGGLMLEDSYKTIRTNKPIAEPGFNENCNGRTDSYIAPLGLGMIFTGINSFSGSEVALAGLISTWGPVSFCMYVPPDFFSYSKGIYDPPMCGDPSPTHAMLLAGYGTDDSGVDYWLVKNSWGDGWGEDGYVRVRRGKGLCGITNWVVGIYG